jgi:hypothetical protein
MTRTLSRSKLFPRMPFIATSISSLWLRTKKVRHLVRGSTFTAETCGTGYVRTYTVLPSAIFGLASGPLFSAGLANRQSILIPWLIKACVASGRAGIFADGTSVWPWVHIEDTAALYIDVGATLPVRSTPLTPCTALQCPARRPAAPWPRLGRLLLCRDRRAALYRHREDPRKGVGPVGQDQAH